MHWRRKLLGLKRSLAIRNDNANSTRVELSANSLDWALVQMNYVELNQLWNLSLPFCLQFYRRITAAAAAAAAAAARI